MPRWQAGGLIFLNSSRMDVSTSNPAKDTRSSQVLTTRVAPSIARKARKAAAAEGQTLGAWLRKYIELLVDDSSGDGIRIDPCGGSEELSR